MVVKVILQILNDGQNSQVQSGWLVVEIGWGTHSAFFVNKFAFSIILRKSLTSANAQVHD